MWNTSPLKAQILSLAERTLSADVFLMSRPFEMIRWLAIEAFDQHWDDDPDRVHDCAVIRRGLVMFREHGDIPANAEAVPDIASA